MCYLAGVAMTLGPSGAGAAEPLDLSEIPESVLNGFLDDVDGEFWQVGDVVELAAVLSDDSRRSVKRRVAKLLSHVQRNDPPARTEAVFLHLAREGEPSVRRIVAENLSTWLRECDEMTRTNVISTWSLHEDWTVRQTAAMALGNGVPMQVGALTAVEHLSFDTHPRVRRAAAAAARSLFRMHPETCSVILQRLSRDAERSVRRAARSERA